MPFGRYFRHQVTPYVILFIERDGSTYLSGMLMSHPQIRAEYERFAVLKQEGASANQQIEWLDRFFTFPLIGSFGAVGFKTKLVDVLDIIHFTDFLQRKRCHIIQMRRNNFVKAVVSKIYARHLYDLSGKWNLYNKADRVPPIAIDIDLFDELLVERRKLDADLNVYSEKLGLPSLKIVYEDLLCRKEDTLKSIFDFLGVPRKPVREKSIKHTNDNLREVVLNFDALREHYHGTEYINQFDERLVT